MSDLTIFDFGENEADTIALSAANAAVFGIGGGVQLPVTDENNTQPLTPAEAAPECACKADIAEEIASPPQGDDAPRVLSNRAVTDRTAGMWKYLPVTENEPEPAPEYLQCDVSLPGGRIIAARVRGKKHKHEGSNCDDWYEYSNVGDVTFAAVSDGAGSKKFSRIGAKISCKVAAAYMADAYEKLLSEDADIRAKLSSDLSDPACMESCGKLAGLVQSAVVRAWDAVETAYYSRCSDPVYADVLKRRPELKDFSGTLLLAAIVPLNAESGEKLLAACQIGDGVIASVNSKGEFASSVRLMGNPDSGAFSGETEFLTSPDMKNINALQKRTKLARGVFDTVMLMSDGVADDYFPNETQLPRLYFDLIINGVLESEQENVSMADMSQKEQSLLRSFPAPVVYPWVNDKSVLIPVQYTKDICAASGLSLEEIWNDRTVLTLAGLELKEREHEGDAGDRLRVWLDNYYERGSFDDRTLMIIQT